MCERHYRRSKICDNYNLIGDETYWKNRKLEFKRRPEVALKISATRKRLNLGVKLKDPTQHYKKVSEYMTGKNNPMWKENISYKSLHNWVNRHLPKPSKCPKCDRTVRLECSNNSRQYLRNIADWEWLCSKCHRQKDMESYIGRRRGVRRMFYSNNITM